MLRTRFAEDLKTAMKARDACRVATLRLIMAALKDRELAARADGGRTVDDGGVLDMLDKMVRQRRESIKMYEQGGRLEFAEREAQEIEIIQGYMPRKLDAAETEQAVRDVIAETGAANLKDIGRAMAALKRDYAGRMDFSQASRIVKEQLSSH